MCGVSLFLQEDFRKPLPFTFVHGEQKMIPIFFFVSPGYIFPVNIFIGGITL